MQPSSHKHRMLHIGPHIVLNHAKDSDLDALRIETQAILMAVVV